MCPTSTQRCERILDAGGTIVGKAHCENFCLSGGSHTNATGPVHNPYKMATRPASSSGSAVLVALAKVDMALGGTKADRSACRHRSAVPTNEAHSRLVPYTGITNRNLCHSYRPMTANVADNACF